MTQNSPLFTARGTPHDIERGMQFQPKFDEHGLLPAIVTDAETGEVLMFAWMNAEALALTIERGIAHFYSRSRGKLWMKGEESGNLLRLQDLLTDCDQDVVTLKVRVEGNGVACHTGSRSCFYRSVTIGNASGGDFTLQPSPGAVQPVVK